MPAGYGIGDHRMFIIDIVMSSMIGVSPAKILRPKARQLNTKLPGVSKRYSNLLEEKIQQHRLIDKLADVHINSRSKEETKSQLCMVDNDAGQYMAHAESKSQRFKSC
jgi:hypothetical protein